jgi:N utilization substance protein B
MASNRHLGRIIALQTLYEQDFRREAGDVSFDLEEVLARNVDRYQKMVDDRAFIEALVRGVASQEADLDKQLQPIAPEWPIDQIARMDRVILRMGLYELSINKDVPPKVVINEAVELAKAFGGENSSKFINGVLGTALRQIDPQAYGTVATADDAATDAVDKTVGEKVDENVDETVSEGAAAKAPAKSTDAEAKA